MLKSNLKLVVFGLMLIFCMFFFQCRKTAYGDPSITGGTWFDGEGTVQQLGVDGSVKQTYTMYNMWPTELGEIAVDWSSDMIQEYTVTWCYDYWSHGEQSSTTSVVSASA